MEQERIEEIRKRCKEATGGAWYDCDGPLCNVSSVVRKNHSHVTGITSGAKGNVYAIEGNGCTAVAPNTFRRQDAEFIAHARQDIPDLLDALKEAQAEIKVDNEIIANLECLLSAIPECPIHGRCIPHAIEYVEKMQAENERLRGNNADWTEEATQDVAALEEKHGIELVSIIFCEQLNDNFQAEHRENERLRASLSKLEPLALKPHTSGQGIDGKWHEARICAICGALFKLRNGAWIGRHQMICKFSKEGKSDADKKGT